MSRLPIYALLLAISSAALAGNMAPTLFAPDITTGGDNGAVAITPDSATVYFMRSTGDDWSLLESHRTGTRWSAPRPASFSGRWRDLDPAMAPDGSYLVFVSNRPASGEGPPIDAVHGTRRSPGHGMNLWRVPRQGGGWGIPQRLPEVVNTCSTTFAPSIAADGTLYYIGCTTGSSLGLRRATLRDGRYQTSEPVALGDATMQVRDPAIAPDQSFIVVSIAHAAKQSYRLAIAFATPQGWSTPQDLGDEVNAGTHAMGAQLGPDHRTLYFYSDQRAPGDDAKAHHGDRIWQVSLASWLDAHEQMGVATNEPWQDNDASPAFAPDGNTVVFSRGDANTQRLYVSTRSGANWAPARSAPFSQTWMDLEPAMAPDGSYLVFASNRPAQAGGTALDGFFNGKAWPGRGGNLWRIAHTTHGWGTPERLPDAINSGNAIFSPAIAADGTLYFMKPDSARGAFRLYVSRYQHGTYQPPQALSFSDGVAGDFDPVVAPDQSFIIFSSRRAPAAGHSALFITFAHAGGWSAPQPLGPLGVEARLSPDLGTLYYSSADQRIHSFALSTWLRQHHTRS